MKFGRVILSTLFFLKWNPLDAFTSPSIVSSKLSQSESHFYVVMNSLENKENKSNDLTTFEIQDISDKILSSQYSAYSKSMSTDEIASELETVFKFWGRKRTTPDNERSEVILNKLEDDETTKHLLNTKMYNIIMNHWIDLDTPYGHQKAKVLMDKLRQSSTVKPDTVSYTSIFRICNDVNEATEMLQNMIHMSKDGNASVFPNTVTYNSVLRVIAEAGDEKALEAAEKMIDEMESVYKKQKMKGTLNEESSVIPNTITYTTIMNAYANSKKNDAVFDAQRIFQRMMKAYQEGNVQAQPNVLAYNTYMKAWVNSRRPGYALQAEQILTEMMDKCKQDSNDDCVKPNVVSFSTVISGWAKCNQPGSEIRAAKVFNKMMDSYKAGNESARPNVVAYSSLIDAYVKSGDQKNLEFAEYIYDKLCTSYMNGNSDVQPTVILANQIMDAWSRSGADDSGLRAERILDRLEQMYQSKKNPDLRPTTLNFTTVINVWAKSSSKEKAKKAKILLDRMIQSYQDGNTHAKPNVFTYTAVLNACAFCSGDRVEKKEALQIATATFQNLESSSGYDTPNHVTYTTFLRVCLNLIPISNARDSAVRSLFQKCKTKQVVTKSMFQLLQNNYSDDVLVHQIMDWSIDKSIFKSSATDSNGRISFDVIPSEWKSKSVFSKERRQERNSTMLSQGGIFEYSNQY